MQTANLTLPNEHIKTGLQILLSSFFIGLCAQIKIPLYFTPVPLTGQTFGILLIGSLLGPQKSMAAAVLYLIEGCLGMPVFAGGKAGIYHLLGPTGGYLLAYGFQTYLVGLWQEKNPHATFLKTCMALSLICYLQLGTGSLWLSYFVGIDKAFSLGMQPFILVDTIKAFLVTFYVKFCNGEQKSC